MGLIGGSLALALRDSRFTQNIIGVETNPVNANTALSLGLADTICDLPLAVSSADLVVLAAPVNENRRMLYSLLTNLKPTAAVVDMGSTKNGICTEFAVHPKREQFVASHPIAGTEYSGPEAALPNLFSGKKAIICEPHNSSEEALDMALRMYRALNCDIIFYDSAEAHDKHVAYVSHISHISSFMLGLTVLEVEQDEKQILQLAGTGFASTVRLAKSSPNTWTPIFIQNAAILSQALQTYIDNLQRFKAYIEEKDAKNIHQMISQANDIAKIIK
jgi:prephenate dehydrogenase